MNSNISNKVVNTLINSSISNYKISIDTGISDETIANYRKGKSKPRGANLKVLSKYLGLDQDDNTSEIISDDNTIPDINMDASIIQRIKSYFSIEGISNKSLSAQLGMSEKTLNNKLNGTRELDTDTLKKIALQFEALNTNWLITGKGDMLKAETPTFRVLTNEEEGVPLLPVEAWGGSLVGSSIAVLAEQCKKYNVPISNIDYLIPIAGDSMMPDYCPGDIVAIKKINERAFIEWGKVYVLDTCNGVVIKEIQPSKNEGAITCISRNMPDKYRPFEVNLNPDEFYGMYAVKGTVRIS